MFSCKFSIKFLSFLILLSHREIFVSVKKKHVKWHLAHCFLVIFHFSESQVLNIVYFFLNANLLTTKFGWYFIWPECTKGFEIYHFFSYIMNIFPINSGFRVNSKVSYKNFYTNIITNNVGWDRVWLKLTTETKSYQIYKYKKFQFLFFFKILKDALEKTRKVVPSTLLSYYFPSFTKLPLCGSQI